jgi:hypothetical protein
MLLLLARDIHGIGFVAGAALGAAVIESTG